MKLPNIKTTILLSFITFTSCKVYHLSVEDNEWQPYEKGDILVFNNSNGKLDTLNIIDSYVYKSGKAIEPYNFKNGKSEINVSIATTNSEFVNEKSYGILDNRIKLFNIQNNQNGKFLVFTKYNYLDKIDFSLKVESMQKFYYKDDKFGDCYLIDEIDTHTYSKSSYNSILFSKKYGYLKFDLKDGSSIKLKKFIRGGVNILP